MDNYTHTFHCEHCEAAVGGANSPTKEVLEHMKKMTDAYCHKCNKETQLKVRDLAVN